METPTPNLSNETNESLKDSRNPLTEERPKYSLCGYLIKHSDKHLVKGLKSHGTTARRRWFVYSESTCRLYYYKSEKEPEPLGEIDVALSSLSYNADSNNTGLFTISSGGKDHILEAPSPQKRLYWLQQLQNARREYTERLNFVNFRSSRTCIGRPESGLVQDSEPMPDPAPDPHHDLIDIMNKSMDSSLKTQNEESPKITKSNLILPLKIFRTSSTPLKPEVSPTTLPVQQQSKSDSESSTPRSSAASPSDLNNFDRLSRKLRSSFRIRRPKFAKFGMETSEEECKKCSQLQEDLEMADEETSRLKDKCEAYKEAVSLLHKDLESNQKDKLTLDKLKDDTVTDEDILAILREKDRRIVELEHTLHKLKNSLSILTANLRDSRLHTEHLEEKIEILTSLIESKDNAIVDLSTKLQDAGSCSHCQGRISVSSSTFYSSSQLLSYPNVGTISIGTQTSNVEYEDLNDKLDGYKCQNTFLNKEILELNLILKHRNEREQRLISESSNWEAKFYQIQSKYLLLLNDLHSPQANQHDSSVLSQLLHDVVDAQGMTDLRVVERQGRGYNEYGFCVSAPIGKDIFSKAEFLQKQAKTNARLAEHQKNPSAFMNWESQWESFLAGTNAKELPQHPELKFLIREGIPYQYKGKVWRLLIESHIGKYKATLSSSYYQDLLALRTSTSTLDPSAKQIELDLLRTLPNNRHYDSPYSDGIPKLRRVLLAYSRHNLVVGYCQGLNRLGAIALLFLNEEDAFWCLVYIIECLMPKDFYTRNLFGSQVDQRVLKDLISEKLPRMYSHFEQHGLDISLFTFNWFLCIYVDAIPHTTYLYIWDSFLYEGSKVLFRFAIAIFKLCEEDILGKKDYMSIFDYLRSVPDQVADLQKLKQMAFRWANPLSMKYIRNRREHYKAIVQAELDEVEEIRKSYYQSKPETKEVESEKEDDETRCEREESSEERKMEGGEMKEDKLDKKSETLEEVRSKYDEFKENIRLMKSNGKKLLLKEKESQKKDEIFHSVKLVPKVECEDVFDDEQFEVITLKRDSSSDTDEDPFKLRS